MEGILLHLMAIHLITELINRYNTIYVYNILFITYNIIKNLHIFDSMYIFSILYEIKKGVIYYIHVFMFNYLLF